MRSFTLSEEWVRRWYEGKLEEIGRGLGVGTQIAKENEKKMYFKKFLIKNRKQSLNVALTAFMKKNFLVEISSNTCKFRGFIENIIYACNMFWSITPLIPSHPIPYYPFHNFPFTTLCPFYFLNSLRQLSSTCMCVGVRLSTEAWALSQELNPLKNNLTLTVNNCQ